MNNKYVGEGRLTANNIRNKVTDYFLTDVGAASSDVKKYEQWST